jgi:hypothetical protein
MAIGNKNNNYDNKNVYFVNIVTKEKGEDGKEKEVKPYFLFLKKNGEKYEEFARNTAFSGHLSKVGLGEREVKGTKVDRVKVFIEDGDDVYILDQGYTILSRSFYNSLLSLESRENININIYQTKPNDKGNVFPQISLWQADKLVRWKYEKSDLPEIKKVKVKGKEMSDTEDVDNFFKAKLGEKFKSLGNQDKSTATSTPQTPVAPSNEVSDEDVPF